MTSPFFLTSKYLNSEPICFFIKVFLSKLLKNSLGLISDLFLDKVLKYFIVSKTSSLLYIFPFKNITLPLTLSSCLELKLLRFLDSPSFGDILASDCLCTAGSRAVLRIVLLALVRKSILPVLNFYSFSYKRCLIHCIFLFYNLNCLFFSTSSTSS